MLRFVRISNNLIKNTSIVFKMSSSIGKQLLNACLSGSKYNELNKNGHFLAIDDNDLNKKLQSRNITREIICTDAIEWLKLQENESFEGCVFTSLPDISELEKSLMCDSLSIEKVNKGIKDGEIKEIIQAQIYKEWFVNTVTLIMSKLKKGQYAIFLQSDTKIIDKQDNVLEYIDKSHLCSMGAFNNDCKMMFHKLCTRGNSSDDKEVYKRSVGRPNFSHLICYGKGSEAKYFSNAYATPDINDRGDMLWSKGIGLDSCLLGLAFLRDTVNAKFIIDPFCGVGTVPAMANSIGISSLGIEISSKRCRQARKLDLDTVWKSTLDRSNYRSLLGFKNENNKFTSHNPRNKKWSKDDDNIDDILVSNTIEDYNKKNIITKNENKILIEQINTEEINKFNINKNDI